MKDTLVSAQIRARIGQEFPDSEQPQSNQPYDSLPLIFDYLNRDQLQDMIDEQLAAVDADHGDLNREKVLWGLYFQTLVLESMAAKMENSND